MIKNPIQMAIESRPDMHDTEAYADWANEHAHAIETALRQHQQDGGWLPISDAPKSGEILALIQGCDSKKFRRVVLSYDEFQEEWRFDGSAISNAWSIVGYQPLPPAPKKENDDAMV